MRVLLPFLLSALIVPHARAAVQSADCEPSPKGMVPMDRNKYSLNNIPEGSVVSVDGVLNAIHASQHFVLQVCGAVLAFQLFLITQAVQFKIYGVEGMMRMRSTVLSLSRDVVRFVYAT